MNPFYQPLNYMPNYCVSMGFQPSFFISNSYDYNRNSMVYNLQNCQESVFVPTKFPNSNQNKPIQIFQPLITGTAELLAAGAAEPIENGSQPIAQNQRNQIESESIYRHKNQRNINNKRNTNTNLLHQALTFMSKEKKSGKLVLKIFKTLKQQPSYLSQKYYLFMKEITSRMHRYINLDMVMKALTPLSFCSTEVYSKKQQFIFCKAARILLRHFFLNISALTTLNSRKIKKNNWALHFTASRLMLQEISQHKVLQDEHIWT